ncbi:MAG: SOS response-associated peptidase [Actinomycetota bacterium]|nr:SOS response-associated peptidase [Actinomycetota bacterium]
MCGRYTSITPMEELAAYFGAEDVVADDLGPRYNVAPTDEIYAVVRAGEQRRLGTLRWGLVPPWADDPKVGARMINARAESLSRKPAFRQAFSQRRCLLPADGFYEWHRPDGAKVGQPWYVRRPEGEPLALAGLWERWRPRGREGGEEGEAIVSAAVITTTANETLAPLHDRMPVVLAPEAWEAWLDPGKADLEELAALLVSAPDELLAAVAVSPLVNKVANDGPALVEPIPELHAAED